MSRICVYTVLLAASLWLGDAAVCDESARADLAFVTYIGDNSQEAPAAALAASIRKWGGEYADCPVYVVLVDPGVSGYRAKDFNVELVSLELPDEVSGYPFAWKAWAAARVEELTEGMFSTLVWLDPETMILRPPTAYDLKSGFGAAVAPVALINTGQPETEPVDAYWAPIYERCGLDMAKMFTVETKVDCKQVRVWLNCGMFSVRPDRGLLREWKLILGELIADSLFQKAAITDAVHRTFLHQAVISTLIVSRLERSEISMLPNDCNYPLFLHGLDFRTLSGTVYRMPEHKRVSKFSELTSVFLESLFERHPDWIKYVPPVDEPMKSWLIEEYHKRVEASDERP